MRGVIVPDGMGVEHLSGVKSVISGILKPHRQVVLIVTILDEDWKSTYSGQPLFSKLEKKTAIIPYGGFKSVTLVLCANLPVHKLARDGQHTDVVQK